MGVGDEGNIHPSYTRRPFRTVELNACLFVFPHSLHKQPPSTFMSVHDPPPHTHRRVCTHTHEHTITQPTYIHSIGFLPRACQAASPEGCGISLHCFVINLTQRPAFERTLLPSREKKKQQKNHSILVVAFSHS